MFLIDIIIHKFW